MEIIERSPTTPATASIIWMHGLGGDGEEFLPIIEQFKFNNNLAVKWLLPNAPIIPVTINKYLPARAWYDIKSFADIINNTPDSHQGILGSAMLINEIIEQEINLGIKSTNIVLAGFSQGGALALHAGLRSPHQLGGIMCLSGYLPWPHKITIERNYHNQMIPIILAHGKFDQVIPIDLSKQSYQLLQQLNYPIEWYSYSMEHTIIEQEILDLNLFLHKILNISN